MTKDKENEEIKEAKCKGKEYIPFSVIPKLAKAPYLLLYAIAVEAPTA